MHNVVQPILQGKSMSRRESADGSTHPSKVGRPSSGHGRSHVAESLLHREQATAQMVRALDDKIARLTQARADRIHALNKIR